MSITLEISVLTRARQSCGPVPVWAEVGRIFPPPPLNENEIFSVRLRRRVRGGVIPVDYNKPYTD